MADFAETMRQRRDDEARAKRRQAAYVTNMPQGTGSLTDTPDTLRMQLAGTIGNALQGAGASGRQAYGLGNKLTNLAEFSPFGVATAADDLARAGNMGEAQMAAIGLIPGARGVGKVAEEAAAPLQRVAGTWGVKDRPDVMFEGVSPHEFTPGQWGRFGEAYGAHNIGPTDEAAWYASLQPFTAKTGQEFKVPGGLESQEPFTYFDDLFMKSQGINPNDLSPEQHLAIHNRTVGGKQAPPGGFSDEQVNNQLQLALLSPNNPLTPNEFAVAATMAKHGDEGRDLRDIAEAAPGFDYAKHPMYGGAPDPTMAETGRRELSHAITSRLGTQAAERGGSGVSGNQDYTTLVGLAQMMREKPEFFRFRGAGEGSEDAGDQWLNFVDRLQTQVPGLAGKTGSFGAVWQDPAKAATSAMDRHMLNTFREQVFENPEEEAAWTAGVLKDWNTKQPKPKKQPKTARGGMGDNGGPPLDERVPVSSIDEMRLQPGGTDFFNDKIFGYVNKAKKGEMRLAKTGGVNPNAPAHLQPEAADYVKEPKKFQSLGPAYRRGIEANVASKEASGATGVFSDQWRVWDPIRQRFEPHEIMQPGLADVPRMSERQQADALASHADLGYLNYVKDPEGRLQGVRPSSFKEGEDLTPERQKMAELLSGLNPSRLAYFQWLTGLGLAGGIGNQALRPKKEGSDREG